MFKNGTIHCAPYLSLLMDIYNFSPKRVGLTIPPTPVYLRPCLRHLLRLGYIYFVARGVTNTHMLGSGHWLRRGVSTTRESESREVLPLQKQKKGGGGRAGKVLGQFYYRCLKF